MTGIDKVLNKTYTPEEARYLMKKSELEYLCRTAKVKDGIIRLLSTADEQSMNLLYNFAKSLLKPAET